MNDAECIKHTYHTSIPVHMVYTLLMIDNISQINIIQNPKEEIDSEIDRVKIFTENHYAITQKIIFQIIGLL